MDPTLTLASIWADRLDQSMSPARTCEKEAGAASGTGYCYSCVWAAEMASFHSKITWANTGDRSMHPTMFIDQVSNRCRCRTASCLTSAGSQQHLHESSPRPV